VGAKSGHDLVAHFANGLPALFKDSLVDVTDIADRAAKHVRRLDPCGRGHRQGRGQVVRLFPDFLVPFLSSWRTDVWESPAVGYTKDHSRPAGPSDFSPKLKAAGNPVGCAVSQTSDAEHTWRSLMWSNGAYEFSKDGKTVTIDSPETRTVLNFAKSLYANMENSVLSWPT